MYSKPPQAAFFPIGQLSLWKEHKKSQQASRGTPPAINIILKQEIALFARYFIPLAGGLLCHPKIKTNTRRGSCCSIVQLSTEKK